MTHVTRQFPVRVDQAAAIDYLKDFSNAIWVFESTCWPRRCFPDWRSARRALTLNAIDAGRLLWTRSVGLAA